MIKNLLLILCCFFNLCADAQQWEWAAKANSTTASQTALKVCHDNFGNVYALGSNSGIAVYGNTTLDSGSFVVKYDLTGNVVWSQNIQGQPVEISCDAAGNLFIAGNFNDSIAIGSYTLTSKGNQDFYIAKLSSSGAINWVRSYGGVNDDKASDFAVDNAGNSYITGFYSDSILLDNLFLKDSTVRGNSSYYYSNFYLTKINPYGAVQWANSGPINYSSTYFYWSGSLLCLDKNQNIYVVGKYSWPNNTYYGYFIMKYNNLGILKLNKQPGSWDRDSRRTELAVDDSANIFSIGNSTGHYYFSPVLEKYDSLMGLKWQQSLGGDYIPHYTLYAGVSVDSSGSIYVCGTLGDQNMQGDSLEICNQWMLRKGRSDLLIGKFDRSGNCIWFKSAGGRNDEGTGYPFPPPINISVDKGGNCYTIGDYNITYPSNIFNDTVSFDNTTLINDGSWKQIFVAKLSQNNVITSRDVLETPDNFYISPNPSTGVFTLNLNHNVFKTKVCVFDVLGNCIWNKEFKNDHNPEIDLTPQSKGVYFVEILADGQKKVKKVVLQ